MEKQTREHSAQPTTQTASPAPVPGKRARTASMPSPGQVQRRSLAPGAPRGGASRPIHEWMYDPGVLAAHGFSPDRAGGPVQAGGAGAPAAGASGAGVQAAAARGTAGSAGPLPHLGTIQQAFGAHSLNHVRAHVGGAAAEACDTIGAVAYAQGDRVAFAGTPDLHTAAHEAAHVVQQRGGVQLAGGVGRAGDRYERHADVVADAVVAGRSAEGLLDQMAGAGPQMADAGPAPASAVQRFESHEHKVLGDEGTRTDQGQTRTIEVAPSYFLTFGDVTAMAGDFFESVEQIRQLAANDGTGAGTREEIEYVRVVKVAGQESRQNSYSQAARDAVDARFYRLAGNNSSHFTEPHGRPERTSLNNAGNYRDNHDNAVREAARAGAAGEPIDSALLCEGFASHFLTDSFAAGHVRTERISISEWWNPKIPMFWTNLKLFIAEQMAWYINDNTNFAGAMKTVQQLWETVRATIDGKDLPTLTFGDLVSGAVHDYDNEMGVETQHGRLVGDAQLRDAQGQPVIDPSTGARDGAAVHTENLAIGAVRTSLADVERAYELGGAQQAPGDVIAGLRTNGLYAAEQIWPEAQPQSQQPAPRPRWQQNDVASLIADAAMHEAITIFAREKASSLEDAMTFDDETFMGAVVVSGSLQARGFRERVTDPLRTDPMALLGRIIDYTPSTGGGVAGSDTDDNAMEYVGMVRQEGAMSTLTRTQRTGLIRDLVAGSCADDEEQAIIELLQTCSVSEMTAIVTDLGGGDAEEGIDYLDSGVDGAEWDDLEAVLRSSSTLRAFL